MRVQSSFKLTLCSAAVGLIAACGGGGGGGTGSAESFLVIPQVGKAPTMQEQANGNAGSVNVYVDAQCTSKGQANDVQSVWFNGSNFAPGTYYVQVTNPSGNVVLTGNALSITVDANGDVGCTNLWTASGGFAVTPNPGGVYKLALSTDSTFPNGKTKTSTFHIRSNTAADYANSVQVLKFYDTNANGQHDADEPTLSSIGGEPLLYWPMTLEGLDTKWTGTPTTPGAASWSNLLPSDAGSYTLLEGIPLAPTVQSGQAAAWYATNAYLDNGGTPALTVPVGDGSTYLNRFSFSLAANQNITVKFGNMCQGALGGLTKGFWHNKNGNRQILTDAQKVWNGLNGLSLRNPDGSRVEFSGSNDANLAALNTFLVNSSNASNMASQLSAQLAAMWLNANIGWVPNEFAVDGREYGFLDSAHPTGYLMLSELFNRAVASLTAFNDTTSPHAERASQERMKSLLDALNNNDQLYVLPPSMCVPSWPAN